LGTTYIFSPLLNSSSSRFVLLFHSPSSYLLLYFTLLDFYTKVGFILKQATKVLQTHCCVVTPL